MAIDFLNADLEITSEQPLDAIRDAFALHGQRFSELYCRRQECGVYFASFEAHPDCRGFVCPPDNYTASAEERILAFCEAIEAFPADVLLLWFAARDRVIDLGYEADDAGMQLDLDLDLEMLRRLEVLKIKLEITVHSRTQRDQVIAQAAVV